MGLIAIFYVTPFTVSYMTQVFDRHLDENKDVYAEESFGYQHVSETTMWHTRLKSSQAQWIGFKPVFSCLQWQQCYWIRTAELPF